MGLFGSSHSGSSENPEIRQIEKLVANEAKNDQKKFDHAVRDLKKAEKTHKGSVKSAEKAQHALDKAVKEEHNAAHAVTKAEHQHDDAISDQRNAVKTLELEKQHETRLVQDLEKSKVSLDETQQRKSANEAVRESKLSQVHEQAATRARVGSFDASNDPVPASGAGLDAGLTGPIDTQKANVGGNDA